MPTLRTTCVFVTALTLSLSASATHGVTTPTPLPTVDACNPSAQDCPVGKQCNCCCGTWVCMPPYLPCCALPCSEPTQVPTPTITPTPIPTISECNPFAPNCPSDTTCGCCCGRWECLNGSEICCEIACVFPTPTPSATPTPTSMAVTGCIGDCNGDGAVTVNELITGVDMALGFLPGSPCLSFGNFPVAISNIVRAVDNALNGCPTGPPSLSLSVHVARDAATRTVRAVADLRNGGAVPVSYLEGCSALCRPKVYQAISFELIGPQGTEVIVEDPCGSILLCAEFSQLFSPGDILEQTLDVTGTEWIRDGNATGINGDCGTCTEKALATGRYKVIAQFQYSTDLNNPWTFPDHIEASAEFDWP